MSLRYWVTGVVHNGDFAAALALIARRGFRAIHAVGFELVLIIITIPVIAWWSDSTIWHALVLDICLVLFYLPYAFCFNLGYDKLRQKIISVT